MILPGVSSKQRAEETISESALFSGILCDLSSKWLSRQQSSHHHQQSLGKALSLACMTRS
jgi:hypothetical protein